MLVEFGQTYPCWQFPANRQSCDDCRERFHPEKMRTHLWGMSGSPEQGELYGCGCGNRVHFDRRGRLVSFSCQLSEGQRCFVYGHSFLICSEQSPYPAGEFHSIRLVGEPQTCTQLRRTIERATILL